MKTQRLFTGVLLIITPILFMTAFTLLQVNFEYPDILRKPAAYVLEQFTAGGTGLLLNWYAMLVSAILFIPAAIWLHPFLADSRAWYLPAATGFGVLAGVVQMLGFARWPFLIPTLANLYLDPASSPAARQAVEVVFSAFNQYAGVAVGEHLGYLFTALWSVLVASAMLRSANFPRWLAWPGLLAGLGILFGILEPAGIAMAGAINAIAYTLFAIWLLVSGVFLLASEKNLKERSR